MPFPFAHVCDLLERLDQNRSARSGVSKNGADIIRDWFQRHQASLLREDNLSGPLLSVLLPEKRTDRVYCIREKRLHAVIGRALGLGRSRLSELARWTNPDARVDLADCVELILKETPNPVPPTHSAVTVEEIDELLHAIAATCRFSSPAVRRSASKTSSVQHDLSLGSLYQRVSARDAKWLTRLILKNYEPVYLDFYAVCSGYHPALPSILKVQDDLQVAGRILDKLRRDQTGAGQGDLARYLKPTLGVKVGRQTWFKGRSIKHCLSMLQGRVSCEEKMDGEYCQIHIDLSRGYRCIQIFSKSGKDSTQDRLALHDSIRKSLQLGQPSCPLKRNCILEGELVVYSDRESRVLDFHAIRRHVLRSGARIGTGKDSQPHPWEHLMIVYYDLLMVDDESLLAVKHSDRFQRLKNLITIVPGRSAVVQREVVDFSGRTAASDLRRAFAKCITARKEGLVLKADDPYFDFRPQPPAYSSCIIKLKKEYIGRFGEIGDFAVVGARFDPAKARVYNIPGLKWTHFYVACLENKEEVQRFGKRPRFVVTNVVELNAAQLQAFRTAANPEDVRPEDNTAFDVRMEPGVDAGKRPSVLFPTPPVFDIRCFSFDKEGNTGFWSPRFPSVAKIHCDRTYHDVISFSELQEMAAREKEAPLPDDSQELLGWIAELENLEATSQMTVSTAAEITPSPQRPLSQLGTVSAMMQAKSQAAALKNRKRPLEPPSKANIPERTKLRRCSDGQSRSPTPLSKSYPETASLEASKDPPDAVRDTPDGLHPESGVPAAMSQPASQDQGVGNAPPRHSASFHEASFRAASTPPSPRRPSTASARIEMTGPRLAGSTGAPRSANTDAQQCTWFPGSCQLERYSILLSPCIADYPYVSEDLLRAHGARRFLRDPAPWKNPNDSGSNAHKRLILVDARRKAATIEFLRLVEAAGTREHNGTPRRIPVFDWHVLQELNSAEEKQSKAGGAYGAMLDPNKPQSVWRKYLVGLV
ncbi:hypothetical protein VTJ83DRAFT_5800 [Remersonia thermophila]|uniref:ATP-dependent DNA ligase family profile domain-containing protein n=1 Tax=Remersonia thermophila TaxID=72144 RepID=A0ABR4D7Y6_9PEZI